MLVAALRSVTLDCSQPALLAEFYRQIAGGELIHQDADFVYLAAWPLGLAFQRTADHHPARQPDPTRPMQAHLDFHVDEARLDDVEAQVLALGASRPARQPRSSSSRVLLDPAGHPFCLTSLTFTRSRHEAQQGRRVDPGPLARFTERHRRHRE